jgi:hypothetical protein
MSMPGDTPESTIPACIAGDCPWGDLAEAELDVTNSCVQWLIDNSEGVVGLRLNGAVMPWSDVVQLYMPHFTSTTQEGE